MADRYKSEPLRDGGFQAEAAQPSYSLTPAGTRGSWAMSNLMQQGYTAKQAAGIVGNWMSESGPYLNPQAKEGVTSTYTQYQPSGTVADLNVPKRGGYGLFQVTAPDRKAAFKDFLASLDPELGAFAGSLAAASNEINTSYPGFLQASTIPQATAYGLRGYEMPEDQTEAALGRRLGNALAAYSLAPMAPPSVTPSSVNGWGRDIRGDADYGPPVLGNDWTGAANLTAPLGAVSSSSLPDITPQSFPSISSDSSGFHAGYPSVSSDATGGLPQGFETGGGFGMDANPYGFSGMQPSAALTGVQNDLSRQYASTTPSGFDMSPSPAQADVSPYGFSSANAGSFGDFSGYNTGSPFGGPLNTAGVNPRIGDANLTGLQANKLGYPDMSLAPAAPLPQAATISQPSFASTWDVPKAPTADPYGMPPAATETPSVGTDFSVSLPEDVPAPSFAQTTAPAPLAAPKTVSKPVVAPLPPPKVIRSIAPVQTFDQPQDAVSQAPSSAAMPNFGSAFNSLWSPTNALQNRQAFSNATGMNQATLNALTNAYDNGGMLTGVAYSGLQDAFNNAGPQVTTSSWGSSPSSGSSSSPNFGGDLTSFPELSPGNFGNSGGGMQIDRQGGIVGSYGPGGGLYGGSINDLQPVGWAEQFGDKLSSMATGRNIGAGLGTAAGSIVGGPVGGFLGGLAGGWVGNGFANGFGNNNQSDRGWGGSDGLGGLY